MNKGELVSAVAEKAGLSRGEATRAIESTFEVITRALSQGDEVKVVGFGSFLIAERAAGEARNPRTGEKVSVAAAKMPKFRAGAQLRSAVNSQ
jgi:DNA-binding protein HU-beta